MKTNLLFLLLLIKSFSASAQVFVGAADINQINDLKVIEVSIEDIMSGDAMFVSVDYGQHENSRNDLIRLKSKDRLITDPVTKEKKVFASTAALINFLENNGWEHYNSLPTTDERRFLYYFRKKERN